MERIEHLKLKKAVVTLRKLDMLREVHFEDSQFEKHTANGWRKLKPTAIPTLFDLPNPPATIDQSQKLLNKVFCLVPSIEKIKGKQKGKSDSLEESEDPCSESVSTGSGESNVVGTDDDDLEKKIQAFAIPVKKENEKMNLENENTAVKVSKHKSNVLENCSEISKHDKKVYMKDKKRVYAESEMKTSKIGKASALVTGNVSNGTRKKKDNKSEKKSNNEEKHLSAEKSLPTPDKQNVDKISHDANDVTIKSSEHKLKNEKDQKRKEDKSASSVKKKVKEHFHQDLSETDSEISQKNTIQKDEKSSLPLKVIHARRNDAELSSESTIATVDKKRYLKNTEGKQNVDATKKAKLNEENSLALRNNYIKTTRNTRKFSISNEGRRISESTSYDSTASFKESSEELHASKTVTRKRLRNIKGRIDDSLKKDNTVGMETKEKPIERKSDNERKRKPIRDSVTPKDDDKRQQKRQKLIDVTKNCDKTSVLAEKNKISCNKVQNQAQKPTIDTKEQTNSSDMLDDGDELFEKIYDILEDSCKILELAEKRNSMSFKLHPLVQKTVSSREELIVIPNPSIFKPKLLQKHTKFPSGSKGTVPYQKLWKWSHYVKMPSDMWSINKHPNGNFVVVFHVSEMSLFPNLIIDKCVLFKETASPCVKIYGKDVLALSSEDELKTPGNVCDFLKRINEISLCEGKLSSTTGESSENCELYTDEKVSMPFKCKFCQYNS